MEMFFLVFSFVVLVRFSFFDFVRLIKWNFVVRVLNLFICDDLEIILLLVIFFCNGGKELKIFY